MFKVAQEKLNLEQQVTGSGNGMLLCFLLKDCVVYIGT